ncbi:hypothetical protein JCM5353_004953 [Sporobolomyces roseus]
MQIPTRIDSGPNDGQHSIYPDSRRGSSGTILPAYEGPPAHEPLLHDQRAIDARNAAPPPPGRFSSEERNVEAQRKRYFKGAKSNFELWLDPNGLETFDSLDLVLDADADGRIGSNWSKAQVFETLGSIYRRIDNFLETTRHQGYTSPFAKWDIILQRRSKEEMKSCGEWWETPKREGTDAWYARFDQANQRNYARGGWTSQLRILLTPHQVTGPGTIALSGRDRYRTINGTRLPVLRFKKKKGNPSFSLLVRTPFGPNQVYMDRWRHKEDDHYKVDRGLTKRTKTTFLWTWGYEEPIQQRYFPMSRAQPEFATFNAPFRISPKPSEAMAFSDPYSIEVMFIEPERVVITETESNHESD